MWNNTRFGPRPSTLSFYARNLSTSVRCTRTITTTPVKQPFDKLSSINSLKEKGWGVAANEGALVKALEFPSFNSAFTFLTSLALYSARTNHVGLLFKLNLNGLLMLTTLSCGASASERNSGMTSISSNVPSVKRFTYLQTYKRVFIMIYSHDGDEKITQSDIKMANFVDRKITGASQLDHANLDVYSNATFPTLLSLLPLKSPSP